MNLRFAAAAVLTLFSTVISLFSADQAGKTISLDSGDAWMLAADPDNVGKQQEWFLRTQDAAKPIRVPGTMQEVLGEYHGVAWYWRTVTIPANPFPSGHTWLRFWSIDYASEVWVNGQSVGQQECADAMVEMDVTAAVRPNQENLIAVRVVNPTNSPIDGMIIRECPGRNRVDPWTPGACYNNGGLVDSVELLISPALRVETLYVLPNWKTGAIQARVNVRNSGTQPTRGQVTISVTPQTGGESLDFRSMDSEFPVGDTPLTLVGQVSDFRLWDIENPVLYRVTVRVQSAGTNAFDEKSTNCGFRDFHFEDGYFRLNGKRIFLKSAHFGGDAPLTCAVPLDPGLLRKDFLQMKAMGFNMARCIAGLGKRYVMDQADELGFLVYDESYAAWAVTPSPHLAPRWNRAIEGMIRRDRNHPSVVIWGLLNETSNGPVFLQALNALPLVKSLDDSRVVMLNSGRFDGLMSERPDQAGAHLPEAWVTNQGFNTPMVACNRTGADLEHDGTIFPNAVVALHVGPAGESAVLRFTAPASGEYKLDAQFRGIAGPPAPGPITTGAVSIQVGGRNVFSDKLNCDGRPNEAVCQQRVTLQRGETIDFVSGSGNETFNSDTTSISASITGSDGKVYDAARDWSIAEGNPHGVWSYGYLPALSQDVSQFRPFATCFDGIRRSIGSLSNPGSLEWEDVLADKHPYQPCPHTADVIRTLRTIDGGGRPLFISEYGFGSANNLVHLAGHYDQASIAYAFDREYLDRYLRQFQSDWERWGLTDTFGDPERYFRECVAMEAMGRRLGTSAIRSNPHVIAHSLTACHDTVLAAEGLITSFREPKPGVHDAMSDVWSPLQFCTFVEPLHVVRGQSAHVEVTLVNEDALKPGTYPILIQIWGPGNSRPLQTRVQIEIPAESTRPEPSFAIPIFAQDVLMDGAPGTYHCLARFESGAAAEGGSFEFWLDDPATLPVVASPVTLWGDDKELSQWIESRGLLASASSPVPATHDVLLIGNAPGTDWNELKRRIESGATAVFLCPSVFAQGDQSLALLPVEPQGRLEAVRDWLYQNNDWAKSHPIFAGLPTGLLDYQYYREILGEHFFVGQDVPDEVVAGMINTSYGYQAGLTMGVYRLGAGRVILNSLRVRENLSATSSHPVAEHLLRNMLNYAAGAASGQLSSVTQPGTDHE